jgi:plastocyanin
LSGGLYRGTAAVVIGVLVITAAGCGDDAESDRPEASKPAGPPASDGPRHTVWITDRGYLPKRLTIEVGDRVTFENRSKRLPHSAQDESRGDIDPSPESKGATDHSGKDINYASMKGFATHSLFPGEPQTVVFKAPRTYYYYCTFHASLRGVLAVRPASGG